MTPPRRLAAATLVLALPLAVPVAAAPTRGAPPGNAGSAAPGVGIAAVVNNTVITTGDVAGRARLFALSTGLPTTPETLDRLRSQIVRQLIDERLRLQEIQRRHIVIQDQPIADAIRDIESRNGLPTGGLRAKLAAAGVDYRTLIDQIRVQLGWTQVLRQQLGENTAVAPSEVEAQQKLTATQTGKPEYHLGEIFIPIDDPANAGDAQRFADLVITQLRAGAAFAIVAAEFSQSQNALQGGDMGWVQPNQLDAEVARVAAEMPPGAVSNPIRVPGGISIITMKAKREIGRDLASLISLRQVFIPFTSPLNPSAPTEQQKQALERAKQISASARSCDQIEAANKAAGGSKPSDPGEIRLESVNPPQFRALLSSLPLGKATQPLVSTEGIAVMMVCSRDQKNLAQQSAEEIKARLLSERVELASRQLLLDLRRRADIDVRSGKGVEKS